jgi:hypothetical protein
MKGEVLIGKKIADWKDHQELFCELLEFKSTARLLTIHNEKPETGKSTVLIRFKYICAKEKGIPVSLVPLEDKKMTGSFEMVQHLRKELVNFKLEFPRFDQRNLARTTYDRTPFMPASGASVGAVYAGGSNISGGTVAGYYQHIGHVDTLNQGPRPTAWPSPEFEQIARDECVKAFFEDLKEICQEKTVVLLFDSWDVDRANGTLREWIEFRLLPTHSFDVASRPAFLLIVIAGREEFSLGPYPPEVVCSKPLKVWDEQDIKQFVELHGYEDLHEDDWEWLFSRFKDEKFTVGKALQALKFFASNSN